MDQQQLQSVSDDSKQVKKKKKSIHLLQEEIWLSIFSELMDQVHSVPQEFQAYDIYQYWTFLTAKKYWSLQKKAEWKRLLKLNEQKSVGDEQDLLERIADGYALGKIPLCPQCGVARLKFNKSTGMYSCDDGFQNPDVKREQWNDQP